MEDGKPMAWPDAKDGILVEIERTGDDGSGIVMRLGPPDDSTLVTMMLSSSRTAKVTSQDQPRRERCGRPL